MEKQEKKRLRLDEDGEPIAICPKCHSEIYYVEGEHTTTDKIYPTDTENLEWETDDYDNLQDSYRFLCPVCHEEIAKDEDEIMELFLEPDTTEPKPEAISQKEGTPTK